MDACRRGRSERLVERGRSGRLGDGGRGRNRLVPRAAGFLLWIREPDRRSTALERTIDGIDHPHDLESELGRRTRVAAQDDRAAEVVELERERLARIDLRRDDVPGAVAEPVLAEALGIGQRHTRVEDPDRLVARVVVDDHLARADDRRSPQLARREPGELDVRDRARAVPEVDEGDIRRSGDEAGAAEGRDLGRALPEPVAEDREIVGREIPDDAHIRLMEPEVDPARGDEVDLAELARVDQRLDLHDRRAVEERVTRHQHEVLPARQLDQLPRIGDRGRQRLLDEHVLAGRERGGGQRVMGRDRSRERHGVDGAIREHLRRSSAAAARRDTAPPTSVSALESSSHSAASWEEGSPESTRARFGPQ